MKKRTVLDVTDRLISLRSSGADSFGFLLFFFWNHSLLHQGDARREI